jgi:hypothetical protein
MHDELRFCLPWQFGEYEPRTTLAGLETGTQRVDTTTLPLMQSEMAT